MKKVIFIALSVTLLAVFNYSIYQKEQLKTHGETVLLELAPVDPRSLMQGDYMRLRYAIERSMQGSTVHNATRGYMVIRPDANHVGRFVRFHGNKALQPGEKLLRYHAQYGTIRIVPDSFLFEEGRAQRYQRAKYGVFKFDTNGNHILIDLASETFQPLTPQR